MGKKSGPPAPDYAKAAEKTAAGNIALTDAQTYANRPTQITPWGTSSWTNTPTQATRLDRDAYNTALKAWQEGSRGDPKVLAARAHLKPNEADFMRPSMVDNWTQNITLSPDQQKALDEQMLIQSKLSTGAGTLADQAISSFQQAPNWDALPTLEGSVAAPELQTSLSSSAGDWRQRAQDAVEALQAPMLRKNRDLMEARLANQGITIGSDAWTDVQRQIGDNETRAGLAAIDSGRQEAEMLFGQDLLGAQFGNTAKSTMFNQRMDSADLQNRTRQQAIAEMMMRRGQPLNELNALLTGNQVGMPQMPNFQSAGRSLGADYSGAAQQQYQASLDSQNARAGMFGNTLGGLFSLGSAAMGNPSGWGGLFKLG
jgi:hypothetical protein